jgi:hypothetical protein
MVMLLYRLLITISEWIAWLAMCALALVTRYRARDWKPPPMETDLDFGRFSGRE